MRERRPGVWELIVQLPRDATTARARQLSCTVPGTKRKASRALAAMVAEVAAGKVSSTTMTMGELLARWLDHVDGQLAVTTVREYRRLVSTRLEVRTATTTRFWPDCVRRSRNAGSCSSPTDTS